MSSAFAWIDQVDFAFLGEDGAGRVALFYVNGARAAVPGVLLRGGLSQEEYNRTTAFLLDDLMPTTEGVVEPSHEWARRDAVRGLFVYTFQASTSAFVRVAVPVVPLLRKNAPGMVKTKLVLKLDTLDFQRDAAYSLQILEAGRVD